MNTPAMPELPPLPRCNYPNMQYQRRYVGNLFTADQMRAYALAALQSQPAARNIAAELSLMVLCAVKDLPGLHANMLKDIESAIEANRAAAQSAAAVSDAEILRAVLAAGGAQYGEEGRYIDIEVGELYEAVRAILAMRPQSESEQELRRSLAEAQATISERNAEIIELQKRIRRSPQAAPMTDEPPENLAGAFTYCGQPARFLTTLRKASDPYRYAIAWQTKGGHEHVAVVASPDHDIEQVKP